MTLHWMLWKEIGSKFLVVILVLVLLIAAQRFYQVAEQLFNQIYQIGLLFQLLAYLIPQILLITFPIATVGVVFAVMRRQVNDGEWIAICSSGHSIWRCIQPYTTYALFSTVVMMLLSLWIAPETYSRFYALRTELLERKIHRTLYPNTLSFDLKDKVVYVGDKLEEGVYKKIFIADQTLSGSSQIIYAEKGTLQLLAEQEQIEFKLENGKLLQLELGKARLQIVDFDEIRFLQTYHEDSTDFTVRGLSSRQLINRFIDTKVSASGRIGASIQFFSRFSDPLSTLSLVLMVLVLVIRRSHTRSERYGGYFQLLLLLVAHFLLRTLCREMVFGGYAPGIVMLTPVLLIGGVALWKLHQLNNHIG